MPIINPLFSPISAGQFVYTTTVQIITPPFFGGQFSTFDSSTIPNFGVPVVYDTINSAASDAVTIIPMDGSIDGYQQTRLLRDIQSIVDAFSKDPIFNWMVRAARLQKEIPVQAASDSSSGSIGDPKGKSREIRDKAPADDRRISVERRTKKTQIEALSETLSELDLAELRMGRRVSILKTDDSNNFKITYSPQKDGAILVTTQPVKTPATSDVKQIELSPQERWPDLWSQLQRITSDDVGPPQVLYKFIQDIDPDHPIFDSIINWNVRQFDRAILTVYRHKFQALLKKRDMELSQSVFPQEFEITEFRQETPVIARSKDICARLSAILSDVVRHHRDPVMRYFAVRLAYRILENKRTRPEVFRNLDSTPFLDIIKDGFGDTDPAVVWEAWNAIGQWNPVLLDQLADDVLSGESTSALTRSSQFGIGRYVYPSRLHRMIWNRLFLIIYSSILPTRRKNIPLHTLQPAHSLADYNPDQSLRRPIMDSKYRELKRIIATVGLDERRLMRRILNTPDRKGETAEIYVLQFKSGKRLLTQGHHRLATLLKAANEGLIPREWLNRIPVIVIEVPDPVLDSGGVPMPEFLVRRMLTFGAILTWDDLLPAETSVEKPTDSGPIGSRDKVDNESAEEKRNDAERLRAKFSDSGESLESRREALREYLVRLYWSSISAQAFEFANGAQVLRKLVADKRVPTPLRQQALMGLHYILEHLPNGHPEIAKWISAARLFMHDPEENAPLRDTALVSYKYFIPKLPNGHPEINIIKLEIEASTLQSREEIEEFFERLMENPSENDFIWYVLIGEDGKVKQHQVRPIAYNHINALKESEDMLVYAGGITHLESDLAPTVDDIRRFKSDVERHMERHIERFMGSDVAPNVFVRDGRYYKRIYGRDGCLVIEYNPILSDNGSAPPYQVYFTLRPNYKRHKHFSRAVRRKILNNLGDINSRYKNGDLAFFKSVVEVPWEDRHSHPAFALE